MQEETNTTKAPAQAPSRPMRSEQINELATALAKAQGEIKDAIKDATNPHFDAPYATLASTWDACRQALSKNGLAVFQTTEIRDKVYLMTTLVHTSGQWMAGIFPVIAEKATAQGLGSGLTYARRYALGAMVGVAPNDDDDGEKAGDGKERGARHSKARGDGDSAPNAKQSNSGQPGANGGGSKGGAQPSNSKTNPHGDWDRAKPGWQDEPASEAQIKRMWALSKEAGYVEQDGKTIAIDALKEMLFDMFGDKVMKEDESDVTTKKLTKGMMDEVFKRLEAETVKK